MIRFRPGAGLGLALVGCVCGGLFSAPAAAEEPAFGPQGAERHFQRGVALYTEADYRGALVEFTRAYTLEPNGVVLFNIGETQYQLRDYAGALTTFEQYLVEAPNDSHRALAARNIKELRARVGQLRVITVPPGATVSIDDRVIGQAPLEKPIVVGVGQVNLRAVLPGRPPIVHPVEIAAEDDVIVTLEIPPAPPELVGSAPPGADLNGRSADSSSQRRPRLLATGWVATGILAAGAIAFGVLALNASNDLRQARKEYPTSSQALDHFANRTKTLSIVTDSFTAAALVVGGITLYSTLGAGTPASGARLSVGLGTVKFDARF